MIVLMMTWSEREFLPPFYPHHRFNSSLDVSFLRLSLLLTRTRTRQQKFKLFFYLWHILDGLIICAVKLKTLQTFTKLFVQYWETMEFWNLYTSPYDHHTQTFYMLTTIISHFMSNILHSRTEFQIAKNFPQTQLFCTKMFPFSYT